MCKRDTEDGHHRVADELLDRAAVAFDLMLDARVVRTERRADVLGIRAIRPGGEPHEIDEEDADDLPLLASMGRSRERRRARIAEARLLAVLGTAVRARRHAT